MEVILMEVGVEWNQCPLGRSLSLSNLILLRSVSLRRLRDTGRKEQSWSPKWVSRAKSSKNSSMSILSRKKSLRSMKKKSS
ncbi:hypothetical protein QN277_000992 [Acacia crassicarpa]|uniref:Uncharacterized protein n=1 Tax=Acacia crassicarpa TaxID=499986 RepID=A0AAE1THT5_9FABA|nr:hypothetical protein QN277_000992 [Acacia crassicarpa]